MRIPGDPGKRSPSITRARSTSMHRANSPSHCGVRPRRDAPRHGGQRLLRVRHDPHIRGHVLADLRSVDVHVHDPRPRCVLREVAGHTVVEPHPDRNEKVGVVRLDVGAVVPVHAEQADVQGMPGGHGSQPKEGAGEGEPGPFDEAPEFVAGVRQQHALADEHEGLAGAVDETAGRVDGVQVQRGPRRITRDLGLRHRAGGTRSWRTGHPW